MRFLNPKTGRRFRYDGYFPSEGLVVEFHGHQHWMFPNAFMGLGYESVFQEMQERDRIKASLVNASDLHFLVVREDEPYENVDYLRGRLAGIGILPPEKAQPDPEDECPMSIFMD